MKGRGLCSACRQAGQRGTFDLTAYPSRRDVVLDTWADLSVVGVSDADIAAKLGMSVDALNLALQRARDAGDRRVAERAAS